MAKRTGMGRNPRLGRALVVGSVVLACLATGAVAQGAPSGQAPPADDLGQRFLGMFGFGRSAMPDQRAPDIPDSERRVNCPPVDVLEGTAAYPVQDPRDPSPDGLRYQATIANLARECALQGATVAMKVGVHGRVLVGPKGGPGKLDVPLRISLMEDDKPIYSKLFKVPVTIAAGANDGEFIKVDDAIAIPFREGSTKRYVVVVGFDAGGQQRPRP